MTIALLNGKTLALPHGCAPIDWLRSLPDAQASQSGWTATVTPAAAWRVVEAMGAGECDPRLGSIAQAFSRSIDTARNGLDCDEQPPVRGGLPLWGHQCRGFWFAKPLDASLIGMGMGTGKSAVACALMANWQCQRTLILCPPSVRAVWRRELERHAAAPVNAVILDHGSIAQRTRQAAGACRRGLHREPVVIVLNYEAAWREPFAAWALAQEWDCVVADESHAIKSPDSNVSLFAARLGKRARHRLCLTGTPLAQTPLDAFGQFRFLDPGLFGTSWSAFRGRYEVPGDVRKRQKIEQANRAWDAMVTSRPELEHLSGHFGLRIPEGHLTGLRNADELRARIGMITYHCRTEDVLDLPPVTHEERYCDLSDAARKVYEQLEDALVADLGNARVSIANALARLMRLQQVTSGFLPDDAGLVHTLDTSKRDALRGLLAEAGGEPVVVFCRFVHDLETVRQAAVDLGLRYGELSHRRHDGLTDRGEMRPGLDVLAVQPKTGGLGVDLCRARYAVFFSLSWSLGEYDQALARIVRPAQTRPMTVYHLIVGDSVDARIHAAIQARRDVVDEVLAGLRGHTSRQNGGPYNSRDLVGLTTQ